MYKIKPKRLNYCKMWIKILDISKYKPGPSKYIFLHYYKELWTKDYLQEYYWNRENIDDEIITME
jgi:hypothetical protein